MLTKHQYQINPIQCLFSVTIAENMAIGRAALTNEYCGSALKKEEKRETKNQYPTENIVAPVCTPIYAPIALQLFLGFFCQAIKTTATLMKIESQNSLGWTGPSKLLCHEQEHLQADHELILQQRQWQHLTLHMAVHLHPTPTKTP